MIRFDLADAPALLNLSQSVGWTHTLDDWHTALSAGAIFGHRAGEEIQSSSGIYRYGTELASIGQVIVRENSRRQGLARRLVVHCLGQAAGQPTMLVATPAGQPLYEQLGFKIIEATYRFVGHGPMLLENTGPCRAMTEADLPLAYALDAAAYGAGRSHLLRECWKHVTGAAILDDGSGFAWSSERNTGPVIAHDPKQAAQLISFLSASDQIVIDVPARQSEFMEWLTQAGLQSIGQRPLMLLNAAELPGRRECVFGLASLAYG
jgi:predicted GNAT family N-acyltransferase